MVKIRQGMKQIWIASFMNKTHDTGLQGFNLEKFRA